ncbi:MAG: GAF domain-containing protein [bacterium]
MEKDYLREVAFALAEVRDIDAILQRIIEICVDETGASRGAILIERNNQLIMRAEKGHTPGYRFTGSYDVNKPVDASNIGLTTYVFLRKEPLDLDSGDKIEKHPALLQKYTKKKPRMWYGVPLINPKDQSQTFGVLKIIVDEEKPTGFSPSYRKIVETLAEIARRAISVSYQRRSILEEEINAIISAFEESLTLEERLTRIVEVFKKISNAEATSIWTINKEEDKLVLAAGIGYYDKEEAKEKGVNYEYSLSFDINTTERVGLTAWIAKSREKINIRSNEELKNHPKHYGKYDDINYPVGNGKRCNSFIGVPLQIGDEIIGVIKAENKLMDSDHPENFFTDEEVEMFSHLAIIAAVAIRLDQIFQREKILEESSRATVASISHRLRSILPGAEMYLSYIKDNVNPESNLYTSAEKALDRFQSALDVLTEYEEFVKQSRFELTDTISANVLITDIFNYLNDSFPDVSVEKNGEWLRDEVLLKVNLTKLKEVFSSFIIDSKRYVEKGLKIGLGMEVAGDFVKIIYSDNGPGIKDEHKEKIFEPFFTTLGIGAGLGLTIVKGIIESHEGNIRETGMYQNGVRFEISLPILRQGGKI